MIGGVLEDVDVATESEVHLVVGQEVEMDTRVALDLHRVFDVETVEGDGVLADRRGEGVLHQTDLVVVEVHVCEDLLHHDVQHIARLEEVVDTRCLLTLDDGLLRLRILAVDMLRHGLFDADGENELVRVLALLHLVQQPRCTGVGLLLQPLRCEVVGGQSQFLIFVVFVVVVVRQVAEFLGCDNLLHQFHGGVVLTAVFASLGLDGHLLEHGIVGLQGDVQRHLRGGVDEHHLRLVAHRTEGEAPACMTGDAVLPLKVGDNGNIVPLIHRTGIGQRLAGICIGDLALYILLRYRRQYRKVANEQYQQ